MTYYRITENSSQTVRTIDCDRLERDPILLLLIVSLIISLFTWNRYFEINLSIYAFQVRNCKDGDKWKVSEFL